MTRIAAAPAGLYVSPSCLPPSCCEVIGSCLGTRPFAFDTCLDESPCEAGTKVAPAVRPTGRVVTGQGTREGHLRKGAIEHGNLVIIEATARELPHLNVSLLGWAESFLTIQRTGAASVETHPS